MDVSNKENSFIEFFKTVGLKYDDEGRVIQEVMHDNAPEYNKTEQINLNE